MRIFCKILVVLGIIFGGLAVLFIGLFMFLDANFASTPDEIAKKLGVKLPAYEIVESSDNLDRTASCWTEYCYEIRFKEPLTPKYLKRLEKKKTCTIQEDVYTIEDENPDEWEGSIRFNTASNTARILYTFRDYLF